MTFERMMNRTILGKFISRKSNDKVYFTKTNTPPQMMQIAPNAKKGIFSGCFGLFSQVSRRFEYF